MGDDDDNEQFIEEEDSLARPKSILKIQSSKQSDIGIIEGAADADAAASPSTAAAPGGGGDGDEDDEDEEEDVKASAFSMLSSELDKEIVLTKKKTPKMARKNKKGSPTKNAGQSDASK